MAVLSNKFDILRGWPNASAVAEDFIIGGTANHPHKQGQWVTLDEGVKDGTMTTKDIAATDSSAILPCYLIIEGRDDYSSQFANRVTCLVGGGYMVRLPQTGIDSDGQTYTILNAAASSFAPGDAVKVVNGALTVVADADIAALNDEAAQIEARGLIVGHVMAVNSADNTIDVFVR